MVDFLSKALNYSFCENRELISYESHIFTFNIKNSELIGCESCIFTLNVKNRVSIGGATISPLICVFLYRPWQVLMFPSRSVIPGSGSWGSVSKPSIKYLEADDIEE